MPVFLTWWQDIPQLCRHLYYSFFGQTIVLVPQTLCGGKVGRAYSLPTEAPTVIENTIPSIQCHESDCYI